MTREVEAPKPKLKHLMVVKRMIEEDLGYITSQTLQSSMMSFYKLDMSEHIRDSYEWFRLHIGPASNITTPFYRWGWTVRVQKPPEDKDGFGRAGIFSWSDQPFRLSNRARAYWEETGKDLYEKLMAEKAEAQAQVERLITVRISNSYARSGYASIHSRAGMLLRVVSETPKRLYVELVKNNPHESGSGYQYLGGSKGKYFVDREQVTFDNITEAEYNRICDVESHMISRARALQVEETRAIQELKKSFADRRVQQEAEYESIMQGILE